MVDSRVKTQRSLIPVLRTGQVKRINPKMSKHLVTVLINRKPKERKNTSNYYLNTEFEQDVSRVRVRSSDSW